jgi:hypothetical protein
MCNVCVGVRCDESAACTCVKRDLSSRYDAMRAHYIFPSESTALKPGFTHLDMSSAQKDDMVGSSSDDEEYEDVDDVANQSPITSLFDESLTFKTVNEVFVHEFNTHGFNILRLIRRYDMTQLSYIKLVNFIRAKVITASALPRPTQHLDPNPFILISTEA